MTDKNRVRPRNAASLILLREGARGLEVLIGRRGKGARFMPGRYVFPGGRVTASDARPWAGEHGGSEPRGLLALKHAALRETFEETGLVIGRAAEPGACAAASSAIERAYAAQHLAPAPDLLRLVARAITPAASPIRFHARFFVADGRHAAGELAPSEELDHVYWHALDTPPPIPMQGVTRFMLSCALEAWQGQAPAEPPLYWHRGNRRFVRRVGAERPSPLPSGRGSG
jgi:8-oxo-dGTP pyrophosphatase MutT (NUDIX family)